MTMAQAGTRLSLYLPVRMMRDFQPNSRKISERGVELLDRMIEALRRTPVELRFNPDEIALMGEVCGAWGLQPAAAVFGGLARDLRWQHRGSPDFVAATIALGRPTALNAFAGYPGTGSFLLVDPLGGGTLAAGVVVSARAWERTTADKPRTPFRVTSRLPATGLCSDLGRSEADVREFDRRSHEVARLFEAAGLSFILDLDPASESGGGI